MPPDLTQGKDSTRLVDEIRTAAARRPAPGAPGQRATLTEQRIRVSGGAQEVVKHLVPNDDFVVPPRLRQLDSMPRFSPTNAVAAGTGPMPTGHDRPFDRVEVPRETGAGLRPRPPLPIDRRRRNRPGPIRLEATTRQGEEPEIREPSTGIGEPTGNPHQGLASMGLGQRSRASNAGRAGGIGADLAGLTFRYHPIASRLSGPNVGSVSVIRASLLHRELALTFRRARRLV